MSHQYEHELANDMHDVTESNVRTYPCGYSGSNAMPQPDVLVTAPSGCKALEVKGPLAGERHYVDEEDLQQLIDCETAYTQAYLIVKFQRREPIVIRYMRNMMGVDGWEDMSLSEQFAALTPDDVVVDTTDSGSLRIDKPSTDDWPSATAGRSDEVAVLGELAIKTEGQETLDRL